MFILNQNPISQLPYTCDTIPVYKDVYLNIRIYDCSGSHGVVLNFSSRFVNIPLLLLQSCPGLSQLKMDNSQVESKSPKSDEENAVSETVPNQFLKLDPNGFALRPQPSDDPLGLWLLPIKIA